MQFKVNDIVEAFGLRGKVTSTTKPGTFPISVSYDMGEFDDFTADGLYHDYYKEPSLKLIERPKMKVKKTVEYWVNIYTEGRHYVYASKSDADAFISPSAGRIACVKLIGEYEVEE